MMGPNKKIELDLVPTSEVDIDYLSLKGEEYTRETDPYYNAQVQDYVFKYKGREISIQSRKREELGGVGGYDLGYTPPPFGKMRWIFLEYTKGTTRPIEYTLGLDVADELVGSESYASLLLNSARRIIDQLEGVCK